MIDLGLNEEMVKVFSKKGHFGGSLACLALDLGDSSLIVYSLEVLVLYSDGDIFRIFTKTDQTILSRVAS